MDPEESSIREFSQRDTDTLVELALRAFEPVFLSIEAVPGPDIFARMYPDWRGHQRNTVLTTLDSDETWVVDIDETILGFVCLAINDALHVGEISLIAVGPEAQRRGLATTLTQFSLDRMKQRGVDLAIANTGGDSGHLPARATYEKAGFTPLPLMAYHKLL